MIIVNTTPHDANLLINGQEVVIAKAEKPARVSVSYSNARTENGLDFVDSTYGEIENLPAPVEGTLYYVSSLLLAAGVAAGRTDLIAPAQCDRNEKGHVTLVRTFVTK